MPVYPFDTVPILEGPISRTMPRLFVSMPSRRNPGGDYYDVAHPITAEARNILQATVLDAYEHSLEDETESEEARHTGAQESVAQQVPQTETQATETQASEAQEARRSEAREDKVQETGAREAEVQESRAAVSD